MSFASSAAPDFVWLPATAQLLLPTALFSRSVTGDAERRDPLGFRLVATQVEDRRRPASAQRR